MMLELSKIVCPVDFSERSREAAWYAAAMACRFRSDLHLVYVVEPRAAWSSPEIGGSVIEEILEVEGEHARKTLAGVLPDKSNVRRVVLEGDAALEIVQYARNEKAGLIVMPTHGYGPFRRFIMGSVTTKVLHDAQCPVLTGVHVERSAELQDFGMTRLACALDFGPDSERIFQWAREFAKAAGSLLTVVNVARREGAADAKERLERLRDVAGHDVEAQIEAGEDVAKSVSEVAERIGADLVVIGRGGLGKSTGRLGANSYAIIRQSHCPVISV